MEEQKNTYYQEYEDNTIDTGAPTAQEDILMNEDAMLRGLLELGREKDNKANYRKVQIKRDGKVMIEFRLRPISEDESQSCWRSATKFAHSKPGQPKRAIETNQARYRSLLIYTATVDEDRAKTWDSKRAKEALNILDSAEMIDALLRMGEKTRILEIIDEMSGYGDDTEETAKNF
jgi:hypothetical protein